MLLAPGQGRNAESTVPPQRVRCRQPRAHRPSSQPQTKGRSQGTRSPPAIASPARQSQTCPLSPPQPTALPGMQTASHFEKTSSKQDARLALREAAAAAAPPASKRVAPAGGFQQGAHRPPPPRPCGTASRLLPRAGRGCSGMGWGRGLLPREGASPQPGCSPLAAVCMQGVGSTLTQ